MSAVAPKAHLAVEHRLDPYSEAVKDVMDGPGRPSAPSGARRKSPNDLVKIADSVPESAKKKIAEIKDATRPARSTPSTARSSTTTAGAPGQGREGRPGLEDKVDFYVRGVEGQDPRSEVAGGGGRVLEAGLWHPVAAGDEVGAAPVAARALLERELVLLARAGGGRASVGRPLSASRHAPVAGADHRGSARVCVSRLAVRRRRGVRCDPRIA